MSDAWDANSTRFSDELDDWLKSDSDKTLAGLVDLFGERGFAIVFVLLLGVPSLPLAQAGSASGNSAPMQNHAAAGGPCGQFLTLRIPRILAQEPWRGRSRPSAPA
jgi:hypothetical protein